MMLRVEGSRRRISINHLNSERNIRMNITIVDARMNYDQESGYTGQVQFTVEGHKCPYELTLHSTKGNEWSYGLHFHGEPGSEDEILALDECIEEDDELFDQLIKAAWITCTNDPRAGSKEMTQLY
jgi:hypothetical protein